MSHCKKNVEQLLGCPVDECAACGGLGVAARCPNCNGRGMVITRTKREAELAHVPMHEKCVVCAGEGQLSISRQLAEEMGFFE